MSVDPCKPTSSGSSAGGRGGGALILNVYHILQLEGTIVSDGASGTSGRGGGSGGSIWSDAATFEGHGYLYARGGAGSCYTARYPCTGKTGSSIAFIRCIHPFNNHASQIICSFLPL